MKASLLLILLAFGSTQLFANVPAKSGSVIVVDPVATPDFITKVTVLPLGPTYGTFIVSVPGPGNHDLIGNIDWDFGDGSAPVLNSTGSINHVYQNSGTYTVTLTFTYVTGEVFVISKPVVIP
jgi:hypothetical protein